MNSFIFNGFFALTASLMITLAVVPFFCSLAVRLRFVDVPDGNIKKHARATPYLGGVAVYLGFIFSVLLVCPLYKEIQFLLAGSTLLLITGLVDDLFVLRWYQKLLCQFIAAACFLKTGFYLKEQFFHNTWNIPVSFLWILVVVNAFNLVDVMDGLASILAIAASISFCVIAIAFNLQAVALLLIALIGALFGFFWYNRPNAAIYLGDAGALFIGGFLSTIPFLFNWGTYNWYGLFTPVVILAIPLLEVFSLIIIRTYKGIPFYLASPDHFSLYLAQRGWSKWEILGYVIALSTVLFTSSVLFATNFISLFVLFVLAVLFLLFWFMTLLGTSYSKKACR